MANSIEERLPLLDKEIVRFAFSLSPEMKIKNGVEKYIFRKSVEDLLPPDIVWRKKQGFGTPLNSWIQGSLKQMVTQKLTEGRLVKETFKRDRIRELTARIDGGKLSMSGASLIWTLFALELWYDIYFENQIPSGAGR